MAEDNKGTPIPEGQDPNPGNQEDNIPDWMKEAGWEKDSGTFDESKPVFDSPDEGSDDDIVPADIPSWLEDAAPDGFSVDPNATPAFEGINAEEPYITTGDLIPRNLPDEAPEPDPPPPPEESSPPAEEPDIDVPTWLENLELDEDSQETAVTWLENMPESLRATDEEKAAALASVPETLDPPVDELAWMDEIEKDPSPPGTDNLSSAELSEDLVASELIPEEGDEEQIFAQEEIQSVEAETPDWLQELSDSTSMQTSQQAEEVSDDASSAETPDIQSSSEDVNMLPDWLSDLAADQPESADSQPQEPAPEQLSEDSAELPSWLEDFESGTGTTEEEDSTNLDWLDAVAGDTPSTEPPTASPEIPEISSTPESEEQVFEDQSSFEGDVSPNDETLNTQVPDWLSKIGEIDGEEEPSSAPSPSENEEAASWLDEIDKPIADELEETTPVGDGEVMDWLENMNEQSEDISPIDDLRDSLGEEEPKTQEPVELETAKYLEQEDDQSPESMPDWLSELADDVPEESISLESAIRQSDQPLSAEEKDFLEKSEETQEENADWLAKLDLSDDMTPPDTLSTESDEVISEESPESTATSADIAEDSDLSGGILDRLKEDEEEKPEVPQWLENLKKEEDPQETAILWLKQFVERGTEVDVQDEIKRYTDELNPGDTVPKWMEDLKHEEDPQTTAMLWLEKLAAERPAPQEPKPPREDVEAGWLAELEKEAADQTNEITRDPANDFQDTDNGWLADLEIDEKIKTDDPELPDWSNTEPEPSPEGETPPWMKATSPLEGDFHTDELAGSAKKEVEIPAWLAGYGEGEGPDEEPSETPETPQTPEGDPDEYAWVAETDAPAQPRSSSEPIDLNKAAISQLESILGISYQIAQSIVIYREKHGPFKKIEDLLNVPEITDAQTIEILKPEVTIHAVEDAVKSKPVPKEPTQETTTDERLLLAKALLAESQIAEAINHYDYLIKKKKSVDQVIDDLLQASVDYPVDISIIKTLGDAYLRIDKLDEALEAYSKAEDLLK